MTGLRIRHRAAWVLALAALALPNGARGQDQLADSTLVRCPAVTLVTTPWSLARIAGRASLYLPGSVELCAGTHLIYLVVDSDTITTEVVLEPETRYAKIELPSAPGYDAVAQHADLRAAVGHYVADGNASLAAQEIERVIAGHALSHADSVAAYVYLNLASAALGDTATARTAMESALALEPCVMPAEGLLPPPRAGAWGRARPPSCDLTQDDVLLRSIAVPGLGQYSVGRRSAAYRNAVQTLVPAASGAALLVQALWHYDKYMDARSPDAASIAYDRVSWRAWTGGALLLAAGIFHALNVRNAIDIGREHEAEVAPWIDFGGADSENRLGVQFQIGADR